VAVLLPRKERKPQASALQVLDSPATARQRGLIPRGATDSRSRLDAWTGFGKRLAMAGGASLSSTQASYPFPVPSHP